MALDRKTLGEIADLTDDIGVLSVYVNADPRAEAAARPAWQVRIRNDLAELTKTARATWPKDRWQALSRRLDTLEPELVRLLRAGEPGLGRALFAPLSRDELHTVAVQLPLADLVVCEPAAYLRPLVTVWARGAPTGIAVASGDGLRVIDQRFGLAEEVSTLEYEEDSEDWREHKGPGGGGGTRRSHMHTDLFERRAAEHLARFLTAAHRTLERVAAEREWEFLLVTGDPRLTATVEAALRPAVRAETISSERTIGPSSATAVATACAEDLLRARQRRDLAVAGKVLEGSSAARGLDETLAALQDGRVAQLVLSATGEWAGSRTPDGRTVPEGVTPPGVAAADLVAEPRLGERMIKLALGSDSDVFLVDDGAVDLLVDCAGVGALLRW